MGLPSGTPSKKLNLCQAVNDGLRTALQDSEDVFCFGEDVALGGVFRCTLGLQDEFGRDRVVNTPITEQGIVGAAIGMAAEGAKPVVEIKFADYVFPAFDQVVNEACKLRYREGLAEANLGGMVIRSWSRYLVSSAHPWDSRCTATNHTKGDHTQSPESLFCHVPGFEVVMPRSPSQAKRLLLAAVLESKDPVIFMEPKVLYRAATEEVPDTTYTLFWGKTEVLEPGSDLTVISYRKPLYNCLATIELRNI